VSHPALDPTVADQAAELVVDAFGGYMESFQAITRAARAHFQNRDWHALRRDSRRRLDLYNRAVGQTKERLDRFLGERLGDRPNWTAIRASFERRVAPRPDAELAETFFNSNARRIFGTVGVDPEVEFVSAVVPDTPCRAPWSHTLFVTCERGLAPAFRTILESLAFETPWNDLDGDVVRLAGSLPIDVRERDVRAIEVGRAPFFRGKGAYVVGQLHLDARSVPVVIALLNFEGLVGIDAVVFTEDEASVVFSFARSYFFVELERPSEFVDWLGTIMPRKPRSDLWNAIGFYRHGKTELYRSLLHHLRTTDEKFAVAPGKRGMVMAVFALPTFDVVFKVIRDRFEYPKTVTHDEVRRKYDLVYRHDRAGRLVDAQRFEHLDFPRERFEPELLEELLTSTAETVSVRGDRVVISHLYTERRLVPLDLYLETAPLDDARDAVVDYGQAVKDLAASNIFPGDMLLKNFGVTRHGRLVFYDYDELCTLSECNFRDLPAARGVDEELAAEPWYFVGEHDVFPEEFKAFLGLKPELLDAFLAVHADLLTAAFWRGMQARIKRREVIDVYPYRPARRLRPAAP
jgi:isocitrate dehydrogenase kinase/phosphatase